MLLTSIRNGTPLQKAETVSTSAISADEFDNALLVHGAFGWSGLYPLDQAGSTHEARAERHCNMYFVRISASEVTREKNPVVTEKTSYTLKYRGETYVNEAQCAVCINRNCPANRNPDALEGEWPAGLLVLSLV